MGQCSSTMQGAPPAAAAPVHIKKECSKSNLHVIIPDIKIHSVISSDLDYDHETAMMLRLGEVNDEQLLAEVARRHLDIHDRITDSMVKETYAVGKVLGHGASGEVYHVTHKTTGKAFACKVVKKNSSMNDAQVPLLYDYYHFICISYLYLYHDNMYTYTSMNDAQVLQLLYIYHHYTYLYILFISVP
ncbi:hypothetical protein B484DRAFT_157920 [Ochromonadaceae sp. CCMP2298]|nr:hypothetical protein B484DRAFT_157920 [Ochromonadaceae sp. CCMP2298]